MAHALCDNLRLLMFEKNLKAIDLSKITKVPQATIHRMLTGESKNPQKHSLIPIADFFSVSTEQLLGGKIIPWLDSAKNSEIKVLPVLSVEDLFFKKEKLSSYVTSESTSFSAVELGASDKCFAVKLEDRSMEPLFPEGTIIIVDPEKSLKDGCYAVIRASSSNEVLFRQVLVDEISFLKPLNPDIENFKIRRLNEADECCGILVQAKINY
jgi:SOS-response transcriptional repressor LexA